VSRESTVKIDGDKKDTDKKNNILFNGGGGGGALLTPTPPLDSLEKQDENHNMFDDMISTMKPFSSIKQSDYFQTI
jgi:hypothetical protein